MTFQVPRSGLFTGGVGEYENTDAGRNTHNVLRHGVVEEADYEKRMIKVRVGHPDDPTGSMLSGWIPFQTGRALESSSSTWDAPEVGEAVALLCMSGELSDAVMLPGASYGEGGKPPVEGEEMRPTLHRRKFGDNTVIEYDRENGRLKAVWENGTVLEYNREEETMTFDVVGDIKIHASGKIEILADETIDVIADGNMKLEGARIDLNP